MPNCDRVVIVIVVIIIAASIYWVLLCFRHCNKLFTDSHIPHFADRATETESWSNLHIVSQWWWQDLKLWITTILRSQKLDSTVSWTVPLYWLRGQGQKKRKNILPNHLKMWKSFLLALGHIKTGSKPYLDTRHGPLICLHCSLLQRRL